MKDSLHRIAILLSIASPIIMMGSAVGQEVDDIVTDRPDQTESSLVVPVGSVQIETGWLYETDYYRWTASYPTTLMRVGVSDALELRFTGEYIHDRYQLAFTHYVDQGIGNVSAGAKIHIAKEDRDGWIPETAFIGHLQLPVGSRHFRPQYVTPEFRFTFSRSLGEIFSLSANLGGEWDGEGGSGAAIYTLALGCDLTESLAGYVEAFGSMWGDGPPSHLLDGGFALLAAPNLQFDASIALPFTERGPDFYVSTGVSLRLPK